MALMALSQCAHSSQRLSGSGADGRRAGATGVGGNWGKGVNEYSTDKRIACSQSVYPLPHPLTPDFQICFRGSAEYRRAMARALARREV